MKALNLLLTAAALFLACGCAKSPAKATADPLSTNPTEVSPPTEPVPSLNFNTSQIPDARSFSMMANSDGNLYILFGKYKSLYISQSIDGGNTFSEPVLATGDMPVHVLPIEHPTLAVNSQGRVDIAWLELPSDFIGAKVWYASSNDGGKSYKPGQLIASETEGEVAMVQIALDETGSPILTWLRDSNLRFSRSFDQGSTFSEATSITHEACECCQPQIIASGNEIHIAYRSLESGNDKGDIRDIVMIHSSDEGQTFQPLIRVSDTHWYLPACPIAGPSLVTHDENYFVSWVDGRAEPSGMFTRGDIWFAMLDDGGQHFSANMRVNADETMHNTLPSIAVGPSGRIHVAWEAHAQGSTDTYILYTTSDDNGRTFAPIITITDNSDTSKGSPGKPQLTIDTKGNVTLGWLDRSGVRFASWIDTH